MVYRGLKLDPFQRQAINYIEEGKSVLVAAPTGTGKTLIADYLIEEVLDEGGEVIYTAPVKALSNQKYREYCAFFGRDKVGLITGDLVINRDAPIRIMTTEILRNMLLEGPRMLEEFGAQIDDDDETAAVDAYSPSDVILPDLANLQAVIIDEIHFLDDEDRGTVWEELLIYLPSSIRILGLSATLSNLEEFADWLTEIRESKVEVVLETERAVPLQLRVGCKDTGLVDRKTFEREYVRWRKKRKHQKKKGRRGRGDQTRHIDLLKMLSDDDLPALYFIYSRKMVETLATKLSRHGHGKRLNKRRDRDDIDEHLKAFDKRHPEVLSHDLRRMYRRGIAFHHAGLHVGLKALVEELYEARLIRVLYCTSTFALGINMPARTVIFDSLTKFNGTEFVPLSIREFMQMAGRAGRRGIDPVGTVVVRQDFQFYGEVRKVFKRLLTDISEPVESAFNLSFHSVVNLVDRFDEKSIRYMLNQSFKAYQDAQMARAVEAQIAEIEERAAGDEGKERKKLATLRRELSLLERPRLWENFSRKVSFLKRHGYLQPDNSLNAPAQILSHIKIEEVFVTELLVNGVFEDRTADELFGMMVGLVQTLPRQARVFMPSDEKWFDIFDEMTAVYESSIVAESEELMDRESTYTPELMPLGERWAKGDSLADILQEIQCRTDLSGDLVGGFRRAKDLVSQIRQVHRDDEERWKELTELLRRVSRDEVQVLD